MNYLIPKRGVLSMHSSATSDPQTGRSLILFGHSGTGKTTLSADPKRLLIDDDKHCWTDTGVFNIEGGCYAKTIKLSAEKEPQIFAAIRFGSVLENVPLDPGTRRPDYDSQRYTENTRAAYPLDFIPNYEPTGRGGHAKTVFFLTCDAFGVMPPIAKLTSQQAMYHFLSGYTAKVAGTERGVTEPKETFSACFGAPFLPLPPTVYAKMLGERIAKHTVQCWLVNTGWTGGPYGVGHRMDLKLTRAMVRAALAGQLDNVPTRREPVFGLHVPRHVPGVPDDLLDPRTTWKEPAAYDAQANRLLALFEKNFEQFKDLVPDS